MNVREKATNGVTDSYSDLRLSVTQVSTACLSWAGGTDRRRIAQRLQAIATRYRGTDKSVEDDQMSDVRSSKVRSAPGASALFSVAKLIVKPLLGWLIMCHQMCG